MEVVIIVQIKAHFLVIHATITSDIFFILVQCNQTTVRKITRKSCEIDVKPSKKQKSIFLTLLSTSFQVASKLLLV